MKKSSTVPRQTQRPRVWRFECLSAVVLLLLAVGAAQARLWNTLDPAGSAWRYLDDGSDAGTAWRAPAFDDSAWAIGPAELGYGDGDEATSIGWGPDPNNKYITSYFRRTFFVWDRAAITGLALGLRRDDGGVVYLNGTEVFRTNMPAGTITYTTLADTTATGEEEGDFAQTTLDPALLVDGANVLAVEMHQAAVTSSDLSFDLILAADRCLGPSSGTQTGTVETSMLNEISGLAASRRNPGVLWAHNDSGDAARVYAMNTAGTHLGVYTLSGASAYDWEDLAMGPGPAAGVDYLYVGDIGDNGHVRSTLNVYRVAEPDVTPDQTPVSETLTGVATMTLVYPDGARDAEVLLVDPLSGDVLIVTKSDALARIYLARYPQTTTETITLEYMGALLDGYTVGGDISPDGDEILIKQYGAAWLWPRAPGVSVWHALVGVPHLQAPLIAEPQGEAIAYDALGHGYFTASEGLYQPVYYFDRMLPDLPVRAWWLYER